MQAVESLKGGPAADGFFRAIIAAAGLAFLIGAAYLGYAMTRAGPARPEPIRTLPVIAPAPDFTLLNSEGQTVTRADLLGKIWIADFIFTRCAGPCPELSARMRGLQYATAARPEVRLVSICLDPENDTPAALAHYAKRFQADPDRWWFLTGTDEKYVHTLVEKGFLQTVVPATGSSPLVHSTYLILVDRQGRIRAAHEGLSAGMQEALLGDIQSLLSEPAP
jgi:protein SCO1/2